MYKNNFFSLFLRNPSVVSIKPSMAYLLTMTRKRPKLKLKCPIAFSQPYIQFHYNHSTISSNDITNWTNCFLSAYSEGF